MRQLVVDNYIIDKPIIDILYELQRSLTNGKLRDIRTNVDDIVVSCPHHSGGHEQRPDLNIYIGDDSKIPFGFARCFACDFKGPFYKFVAECFDSTEEYAKNWLISKYGILVENKILIDDPININVKKAKTYLTDSMLAEYQSYCPYLQKRKISREVCKQFNVKYDPKTRTVVFPVYDEKNNLIMIPTRSIDYKVFHLDKNIEKPVYCLHEIIRKNINTVCITEGPFDTLTGWTYGMPTIGTFGTLSDYQIEKINKSCITTIYTFFDNDEAGKRFTEILKNKLAKRILIIEVTLPKGKKDLNELSQDEFKNCIENTKNNLNFIV